MRPGDALREQTRLGLTPVASLCKPANKQVVLVVAEHMEARSGGANLVRLG